MKPVNQTRLTIKDGANCLAACIASMLEVPIEEVDPHIRRDDGEGWLSGIHPYLAGKGLALMVLNKGVEVQDSESDQPIKFIASGKTKSGACHAVIVELSKSGLTIIHDPHPNKPGIEDVDALWLLVIA